jgi:hypothetical protein
MPLNHSMIPGRLAVFAIDQETGLPIVRLPMYAEVLVRDLPDDDSPMEDRLNDGIMVALRTDAAENLGEPQPRLRLLELINRQLVRQLAPAPLAVLISSSVEPFVEKVIARVRKSAGGLDLRAIDEAALAALVKSAVFAEGKKAKLELRPIESAPAALWAYPLGVLATDHTGYLSFDLTCVPPLVLNAISQAVEARRRSPSDELELTIGIYPTGPDGPLLDALEQGRISATAIVTRLKLPRPTIPQHVLNLGLPALQNPSLIDWRLSPGSFATNAGSFIGADGCESILPANLALQEFYFYQVVRLSDLTPPLAPVVAEQVRVGIVNEYRLAWFPLGHSLGQILYSLPLAPGESVNLAVIDWTRRDEAQRQERTSVDEQLVHNEHRDRTISETVNAAVREYQHGSTFMGGIAGALGGTTGAVSGGVAGSLGGSTSSSSGTRDVSAGTVQKLSDNITQASAAARELKSTVVVHSVQSEKEAIETRTVVNYNHSHTLTMLYYEVLRHFRIVTELVRRRPAVLVKLRTDWFQGPGAINRILGYRQVLTAALLDTRFADAFDAAERLSRFGGALADLSKPLPTAPAPLPPDPNPPPHFRYFTFEMMTGGFHREVDDHAAHVDVLASLHLEDGTRIELMNIDGGQVLNNFGAFSIIDSNNVFTAIPKGIGAVPWSRIIGLTVAIVVHPMDEDTAKVSLQHIKVTGIDDLGVPGTNIIDQGYQAGHLIITNGNDEHKRAFILPAKRPAPMPPPPPQFPHEAIVDREKSAALIAHLDQHKYHYSRAIVLKQDPFERASELDLIKLSDGSSVLDHVENRPLELIGDYLAYPSSDPAWSSLISQHLDQPVPQPGVAAAMDERLVTLPTRGVFGEAKLGHCNASEEIDNTRFWDWQQSPIPHFAPEIAPTTPVTPQPVQQNLSPTPLPASIVNIVSPPAAPDPMGLAAAMAVLSTPELFRDMSGRAEVAAVLQNLADNAVKIAGGGAGGGKAGAAGSAVAPGGGRKASPGASAIGGARATSNQPSAINRDLHDLSKVLDNAQSSGLMGPQAAQQAFSNAVAGDPQPQMASSTLSDVRLWLDLITFSPPKNVVAALQVRGIEVQPIFDAMGELNTDSYLVRIGKLPTLGGAMMTAEALLEHIRLHFNDFIDTGISSFSPLEPMDDPVWNSSSPVGAVIEIDIEGLDNAAVVVAEHDARHWRFSTVRTPFAQTGSHPVSGTREWGVHSGAYGLIFYTRGADRPTELLETIFSDIATFPGADRLWRSLQEKVSSFINAHGGQSEIVRPYSTRNPWGAVKTLYGLSPSVTV